MKPFEILEHTADLRIRVFGKNPEELFKNALAGMMGYLKRPTADGQRPKAKGQRTKVFRIIKISSPDLNALLVDFLSEALTLADTNQEVYREAEFLRFPKPSADSIFKKDGELGFEARLLGERIDRFDKDIKAVTYHRLNIEQNKEDFWEATIVFDI